MSFSIENLLENDDVNIIKSLDGMTAYEYKRDLSVMPENAMVEYFCSKTGIRKRQLLCKLDENHTYTVQAGSMQWMAGNVNATTGIKGVGDLIKKGMRGKMTGESAIKPEYTGTGMLVLEPAYKHLILEDLSDWNGAVVLDDGLFLACDGKIQHATEMRDNISSAVAGGEGLFNLKLKGSGVFCLEADCPRCEMIVVDLQDDVLKIDGNLAIAWSASLKFTVERSGKTLLGSAASGEGLVNVYRGTGRVLMMPVKHA